MCTNKYINLIFFKIELYIYIYIYIETKTQENPVLGFHDTKMICNIIKIFVVVELLEVDKKTSRF